MRIVAPSPALSPFVRELMFVDVAADVTRLRIPEPGLVLGVRYRGQASLLADDVATRLPDTTLTGMAGAARRMRTAAGSGIALVRFRPGGAAPFFDAPLHELFGTTVSLGELLPPHANAELHERVTEADGDDARAAILEAFLLARRDTRETDALVAAAVTHLEAAQGNVRIDALARRLAISQDAFEKRFRRAVGASPKQLASLLRIRHAIEAYRPDRSFAELAQAAGFFDQSHFNRELRAVTGQSPSAFFAAGEHRWAR
jgi:methylphosphotriester-DNA--protein-cysteine methyltransferase